MSERIYIGGNPTEEPCVQVMSGANYLPAMRFETQLYLELLKETYPEPEGGFFRLVTSRHDFGSYIEVVAVYDEEDEEASEWAFNAESGVDEWPEAYKAKLNANPAWVTAHKA